MQTSPLVSHLEAQFVDGLNLMTEGLEKIKASESLYLNDPWFSDFITILETRLKVLKTAAEHELDIKESLLING